MISNDELSRQCNPRSIARARQIAASGRDILTKKVTYNGEKSVVSAFVASSSGWDDRYRTSVTLNEADGRIVDYSCTCPAYRQYDGMCKHCAALVMAHNAAPESFMGYREHRAPATSACIVEFMHRAEALAQVAGDAGEPEALGVGLGCAAGRPLPPESVDIEAVLVRDHRSWSARFKVAAPGASYAIKGISEFVERMRDGAYFSYGKKLAFAHVPAVLTPQARAVEGFLERACAVREQTSAAAYWRYRSASAVGRELELSEVELVELLCVLAGSAFSIEDARLLQKTAEPARIVEEDPCISLDIRPCEQGGYLIERGGAIDVVSQGERLYVRRGATFFRCSPEFSACAGFLRSVYGSSDERLIISREDTPLFCATVLPLIERHLDATVPVEVEALKPVPCSLEFYFDKSDDAITCTAWAVYAGRQFLLCGEAEEGECAGVAGAAGAAVAGAGAGVADAGAQPSADEVTPLRDERKELRATSMVDAYFDEDAFGAKLITLDDEEAAGALLFGGLVEFRRLGDVFTTPAFDRLISDKKPRIALGVSLAGNLIDLTVRADDLPAHELSALLGSYRKRKRYHKLKGGAYLDLQDLDLSQLERLASDLGITARQLASGHVELPSYRAFYLDEEADLERDRSFTRYLEGFRAADERAYEVPASLAPVLRPYQADGFRWLSARCDAGFGGILADEMGLGKSVQLISLLLARRDQARPAGPSLIVCPASLVYNWLAEFERFAPELSVCVVAGSKQERSLARARAFACVGGAVAKAAKTNATDARGAAAGTDGASVPAAAASAVPASAAGVSPDSACGAAADVLITSYDLLRADIDAYAGREFFCCVLDEAHYIKNPATLTTRAVKRVSAQHRFALTGTPMENRLSELWSIFDFLMPGLLGPYSRFRERFELPVVGGDDKVAQRLQAAVGPFMLRRLKKDVLADLPDKLESVVYVPLSGEQRRLYDAHEQRLREELTIQHNERKERTPDAAKTRIQVLAELMKLRQLCCDPGLLYENYAGGAAKLDAIMELVEAARDAGEKTLVFSQFTSFLSRIAERLDAAGVAYFTITGATPKKQRVQLVDAFNGDDTPVFLVSLKAGGTGLNLTGASVVVHADPWWNEAAQNQATDRAHRIGQTRVVSVQKVIAKGTIEERILKLQQTKSDLADQVIASGTTSLATLTPEALANLLDD